MFQAASHSGNCAEQSGARGVLERLNQAGDVEQRRAFDFPLTEPRGGVAFKIRDDEVFSGIEDVVQPHFAVDPNSLRDDAPVANLGDIERTRAS